MRFTTGLLALVLVGATVGGCTAGPTQDALDETEAGGDLLGIGIAPNDPVVPLDGSVQFEAKAYYEDTTNQVITGEVSWTSTNERVATVDAGGNASGVGEGEAEIIATSTDGTSAKVKITVKGSGVDIVARHMVPETVTMKVGDNIQMQVIADFSDSSSGNESGNCTWSVADEGVASLNESAGLTGVSEGTTEVQAVCGAETLTASVDVKGEDAQIGKADLRITGVDPYVSGDWVEYEIHIENSGDLNAGAFYVDVFLDNEPNGSPDASEFVPGIGPGETEWVYVIIEGVDAGSYESYAAVDVDGWVSEEDEDNNVDGPILFNVEESVLGPDLVIFSFEGLSDGEDTIYEVKIKNVGDASAHDFYVDLFTDVADFPDTCDLGDLYVAIPFLGVGETFTWEPEINDGPSTFWDSLVFADSCDDVEEQDEDNNQELIEVEGDGDVPFDTGYF